MVGRSCTNALGGGTVSSAYAGTTRHGPKMAGRTKALWAGEPAERHPIFLSELILNPRVCTRKYSEVAALACAPSQEVSLACLFRSLHSAARFRPRSLVALSAALILLATFLARSHSGSDPPRPIANSHLSPQSEISFQPRRVHRFLARQPIRAATHLLIVVISLALPSNLFHGLAASISDDSLSVMATACQLLSIFSQDYGYLNADVLSPARSVSLESGMASSLLLASRLRIRMTVAAQLLWGVAVYSALPHMRHRLRLISARAHVVNTAVFFAIALSAVHWAKPSLAPYFAALQLFTVLICPAWFVRLQRLKCQLSGPWDEATVPVEVIEELKRLQLHGDGIDEAS